MMCNFEYKCRKCGAIDFPLGIGASKTQSLSLMMADPKEENSPPDRYIHLCNISDGNNYGISDLIGMKVTE